MTNGPVAFRERCNRWKLFLAIAWMAVAATGAIAQAGPKQHGAQNVVAPTTATDPTLGITFDVVTIKPSGPQSSYYGVRIPNDGDSISMGNYTVDDMVRWAYHLGSRWGEAEHQDVPKWYETDRYDIQAKVAAEDVAAWHKLNEEARRLVFRKVLAERFKFVCHFAEVEQPVYNLVIAKGGLKMTEAKPDEISPYHFHQPGDPNTAYSGPGMSMRDTKNGPLTVFQRMDMASFSKSNIFAATLDRPVIDKTGLTGVYNFELDFSYMSITATPSQDGVAAEPSSPDIFTALQKQLGLKLEPGRGVVHQLIVDHVERPSED